MIVDDDSKEREMINIIIFIMLRGASECLSPPSPTHFFNLTRWAWQPSSPLCPEVSHLTSTGMLMGSENLGKHPKSPKFRSWEHDFPICPILPTAILGGVLHEFRPSQAVAVGTGHFYEDRQARWWAAQSEGKISGYPCKRIFRFQLPTWKSLLYLYIYKYFHISKMYTTYSHFLISTYRCWYRIFFPLQLHLEGSQKLRFSQRRVLHGADERLRTWRTMAESGAADGGAVNDPRGPKVTHPHNSTQWLQPLGNWSVLI